MPVDDWNTYRHRNKHKLYQIQHYLSLSSKYLRFWCRHGPPTGSIYKSSVQQRQGDYSISCKQVFYEGWSNVHGQRNMHTRYTIQHVDVETVSTYKLIRDAMLFWRLFLYLWWRLNEWNTDWQRNMHVVYRIQHTPRPNLQVFPVSTSPCWFLHCACIFLCRAVFHSSWHSRKPRCSRRNQVLTLFAAYVVSTSGFDVAMLNAISRVHISVSPSVPLV